MNCLLHRSWVAVPVVLALAFALPAGAEKGRVLTLRSKEVQAGALKLETMGFAFAGNKVSAVDLSVTRGEKDVTLTIGVGKRGYALGHIFEVLSSVYREPRPTKVRIRAADLERAPLELGAVTPLEPGKEHSAGNLSFHFASDYPDAIVVGVSAGGEDAYLDLHPYGAVRWKDWSITRVGEERAVILRDVTDTFVPIVFDEPVKLTAEVEARALDGLVVALQRVHWRSASRRGAVLTLRQGAFTDRMSLSQGRPETLLLGDAYQLTLLTEDEWPPVNAPVLVRVVFQRISIEPVAYGKETLVADGDLRRLPTGGILRYEGEGHKHPAKGGPAYGFHDLRITASGESKSVRASIEEDGVGRWRGAAGSIEIRETNDPSRVKLLLKPPPAD